MAGEVFGKFLTHPGISRRADSSGDPGGGPQFLKFALATVSPLG